MVKKLPGTVIKEALFGLGRTQSWLAERVGVSNNAVSKWINTHQIAPENISKISKILGIPGDDLLPIVVTHDQLGVSEPRATCSVSNTTSGPEIKGLCPLISWVQAGTWSTVIDNLAVGDADEWLPCPVNHGPRTYVLRVKGESMHNPQSRPSFADGDLVFVDPDRAADNGSLVVVRLDDKIEATFKKLVIEGDEKYLRALNPGWPEPIMRINGNATLCGVAIAKMERL